MVCAELTIGDSTIRGGGTAAKLYTKTFGNDGELVGSGFLAHSMVLYIFSVVNRPNAMTTEHVNLGALAQCDPLPVTAWPTNPPVGLGGEWTLPNPCFTPHGGPFNSSILPEDLPKTSTSAVL